MTDLLERLRLVESSIRNSYADAVATNWYRNPDGPEAAKEIDRLRAEVAALRELLLEAQGQLRDQPAKSTLDARIDAALLEKRPSQEAIRAAWNASRTDDDPLREVLP